MPPHRSPKDRRKPDEQSVVTDILEIGRRSEQDATATRVERMARLDRRVDIRVGHDADDNLLRLDARIEKRLENDLALLITDGGALACRSEQGHAAAAAAQAVPGMLNRLCHIDTHLGIEWRG